MMSLSTQILIAFCVDLVLGDPAGVPHPVRWIAGVAVRAEHEFRKQIKNKRAAGAATFFIVLLVSCSAAWGALEIAGLLSPRLRTAVSIWIMYTSLACRDLFVHAMRVKKNLYENDIKKARQSVSMIVGRDTNDLNSTGIARAAIESVAENTSDGVIAPLLAMLMFGPVGAVAYKSVNTLDSLFGYKNDKYIRFGTWAARADDILNFVPARLTFVCMALASIIPGYDAGGAVKIAMRDHANHDSPNAGWGEAAMAGALGVKLGGVSVYGEKSVNRPLMGDGPSEPGPGDIGRAVWLMLAASVVCLACGILMRMVLGLS